MADSPCAVRYRRVAAAVAALDEWATGPRGAPLAEVLAGDEVVLARMRAAAAVMRTVPLPAELADVADLTDLAGLEPADGAGLDQSGLDQSGLDLSESDLLEAASRWHRYARGCAPGLHRCCAVDIARGLMRLWDRRRQPAPSGELARRIRLRQARIALLGVARTRCAALRAELRADVAALTLRHSRDFPERVRRRVADAEAELTDAVQWELPGGGAIAPIGIGPPPVCAADDRLGALFGTAFGLGLALTVGRALAGLAPEWTGAAFAVGAATGCALAGWVVATRRLLARRAALDRWVSEVVIGLRAGLEERIAMQALTAEARQTCAAIGGLRRFGDEPDGRSDILAITDRLHPGANVQVGDGSLSALSGTRSVPGGITQAGDTE